HVVAAARSSRAEGRIMEPLDLVPVYSAADPVKAHVIKNMLEEEGLRAFIEDENQAAITGLMTLEVKVLVEASRADEARRLIEPHEAAAVADEQAALESEGEGESEDESAANESENIIPAP